MRVCVCVYVFIYIASYYNPHSPAGNIYIYIHIYYLTWYGQVQRMAEGRLPKIALKWMPKQKRARGRPKKTGWKV